MSCTEPLLESMTLLDRWEYHVAGPNATEPAALTAWALTAHHYLDAAVRPLDWLVHLQAPDGSLGVTATEHTPCWPTALAMLAWKLHDDATGKNRYASCIERSAEWSFANRSWTHDHHPHIGHDSTLVAWPWVAGTHAWQEPTAWFVYALTMAGYADHPRTLQAIRLLVDRLLPHGGCNYGNTIIMDRELLPHVQPTGLTMLALAGKAIEDTRIEQSLRFLEKALNARTATTSLCYGLMGLTAHNRRPSNADDWLESTWQRNHLQPMAAHQQAMIALASKSIVATPKNPIDRYEPAIHQAE